MNHGGTKDRESETVFSLRSLSPWPVTVNRASGLEYSELEI